jgi:DNA-binding SARP family transcriptional activator/predicted ATPase
MPELELTMLGPPAISADGEEKTAQLPAKAQGVVYFLALNPGLQTRSRVAGMLWPDGTERAARASLRTALSQLRKVVGDCFDADRDHLRLDPAWTLRSDVAAFNTAGETDDWNAALAFYRGPFLETFDVGDAQPFDEWLIVERERLHQQAVLLFQRGLDQALEQEAWDLGEPLARRLLALDPWREEAHRGLMRCLAATGRRAAALAQYEACRRVLATELDVEPAPTTRSLYEEIRRGRVSGPETERATPAGVRPPRLPTPAGPLIGRDDALESLLTLLRTGQTRLLTLTGLGGSGKSRLALEAAHRLAASPDAPFPDGVAWVPLAPVGTSANIYTAVAAALGVRFTGSAPPDEQLTGYLRYKSLLLVLDNFEQLVVHATLLSDLLQEAPGLTLLVTSRQRLRLAEEWVMDVPGLPLPKENEPLENAPAVQLFTARARRTHMGFDLATEADGVRHICEIVEGLPLGLELAASWTHVFSCADIAATMSRELHALESTLRDTPERHRSLRAAFEHSWRLLRPEEQAALRKLALFQGGFALTAAERVAGANRRLLADLVEKSLVRRAGGRRYDMHVQLRQFAWAKLPEARRVPAQRRFTAYMAGLIQAWLPVLDTPDQAEAFRTMWAEVDNIREAWRLAVAWRLISLLDVMADGVAYFYLRHGLRREGFAAFEAAVAAVESMVTAVNNGATAAENGDATAESLLARLLVWQGRCGELPGGDYQGTRRLFERGLALAEKQDGDLAQTVAHAHLGLGMMALYQGQRDEAQRHMEASRAAAEAGGYDSVRGHALNMLGWLAAARGDTETGRSLCEEALRLHRRCGDDSGIAAALTTLGTMHSGAGALDEARQAYEEALERTGRSGHRVGQSQALTGLFGVAARQEKFAAARTYAAESLAVSRDAGNRLGMGIAHHNLGYAAAGAGDHAAAVEHYENALKIYAELDTDPARPVNTRRHLAESRLAMGDREGARRALCAALADLTPALRDRFGPDLLRVGAQITGREAGSHDDLAASLANLGETLECDNG